MRISNNKMLGRGSDKWLEPARQKIKQDSVPAALEGEYSALARYMASKVAKHLSDKGAVKGGHARADALTPKQRTNIAIKAAEARWAKKEKDITNGL